MTSSVDPIAVATEVAALLEQLGVPYLVGGSVASTMHGEPRATLDVDFVVHLDPDRVTPLCDALEPDYYVDREAAVEAADSKRVFNAIHRPSMVKVDLHVRPREGHHAEEIRRAVPIRLKADARFAVRVATAEDTVLQKLRWYQADGAASDRQWRDVLGILKLAAGRIDDDYLDRWAGELRVSDLLAEARRASGR